MKPIPAIVEPAQVDIDLCAEQIIVALADQRQAEASAARHQQLAEAARGTAKMRRLEIGRTLARVRAAWPERGPNAKHWGEFLERVKIAPSTARMYIDEFRDPDGFAEKRRLSAKTPAPDDDDDEIADRDAKPANVPQLALVPDPESEVEIDRDTWCTPRWITEAIGGFDLDPCSNERSTVTAVTKFAQDLGTDGLAHAEDVRAGWRVFVNPPYSDVQPWIAAYKHTRFCFLLKLDTSTKWFAELHACTQLILIPRKRVSFDPPPGVPPERAIAQQFPHALFYAHAEDATDAIRALCWEWRVRPST